MGSLSTESSSTVFPANPTQQKHCPLSPFDLQLAEANYIQYVLFVQHGFANNSHEVTVERLKWSLAKVLVYFYPFAGRFVDSLDGFLNIECNDEGAQFTEGIADATLDETVLHKSPRYIQELLFPLNHSICADGRSLPLLAVQIYISWRMNGEDQPNPIWGFKDRGMFTEVRGERFLLHPWSVPMVQPVVFTAADVPMGAELVHQMEREPHEVSHDASHDRARIETLIGKSLEPSLFDGHDL